MKERTSRMRTLAWIGTIGLFLTLGPGPAMAGPTYEVKVAGLSCPFCAYGIEKTFGKAEGVQSVRTNLAAGVVEVEMADGTTLSRAQAERAVDKAGFTLDGFEKTGD